MPKVQYTKRHGFTLIELLISMTIVGILATIGIVAYTQTQVIARDAKRKQDIRAIAVALTLYRRTNGRYPCDGTTTTHQTSLGKNAGDFWIIDKGGGTNCDGTSPAVPFNQTFIQAMPLDPLNNGDIYASGGTGYSYTYNNGANGGLGGSCGNGAGFILRARLENKNDPDNCKAKQQRRCDDTALCSDTDPSKSNELFIVTQ